ncbi:terpene synthase family protein [Candidatus Methylocalor cossyra]|uniref:Terpene synthase n=1 Tax=Candidatus Methylocalor cossyra TaxID=3108543 RepID=A0ABP1CAP2_9GAMM
MQLLDIPPLTVPFETRLNPYMRESWEGCLAWAERIGLIASEKARSRIAKACYDQLAGYAYPYADREGLECAMCFSLWLFLLDDQLDECTLGRQSDIGHGMLDHLLILVKHGVLADGTASRIEHAWVDLAGRIREHCDAHQWQRFVDHMVGYLNSLKWEIRNRSAQRVPDPLLFSEMRRQTGGVLPSFDFIEFANAIALDDDVLRDQHFKVMYDCAVDIVCIVNDIISYQKEAARGEVNNFVVVYANALGLSTAEATAFLANLLRLRIDTFVDAKAVMEVTLDRLTNAKGRNSAWVYISGLEHWMRANLEYSKISGRYHDIEIAQRDRPMSWIENLTLVPQTSLLPPQ